MVFWPAVRSVVKSRLRTSPDIAANLSVSLFGSSRLCPPCLVALLFGACVLTTATASKWCLIIVQCCLSPYFRCSIVNVPAVRWSPLLLSQPEDKDTPGTGERSASLCGFYRLLGKLGDTAYTVRNEVLAGDREVPSGSPRWQC